MKHSAQKDIKTTEKVNKKPAKTKNLCWIRRRHSLYPRSDVEEKL